MRQESLGCCKSAAFASAKLCALSSSTYILRSCTPSYISGFLPWLEEPVNTLLGFHVLMPIALSFLKEQHGQHPLDLHLGYLLLTAPQSHILLCNRSLPAGWRQQGNLYAFELKVLPQMFMQAHAWNVDLLDVDRKGCTVQGIKGNSIKYTPGAGPAVPESCPQTGSGWLMGGPIWAAPLHEPSWVTSILHQLQVRLHGFAAAA